MYNWPMSALLLYITCHTQSRNSRNTGDSCLFLVTANAEFPQRSLKGCPACSHSLSTRASNLSNTKKILYRININLSSAYLCIHNIYSRSFTLSPIPPHTISLSISLNITLNSNSCTCMQILFYKSQSCHKEFSNAHIPLMFSIKVSRMMKESF